MREDYSLQKLNWAKKDSLSPEDTKRLEKFRDVKSRWQEVTNTGSIESPSLASGVLFAWRAFREGLRPSQLHYEMGGGKKQHEQLEKEHSKTKEGQLEQAYDEASFFNDAFDVRADRLQKAIDNKNTNPAEYTEALAAFNELVKDLNEGDLRKYEGSIYTRRLSKEYFGPREPSDLRSGTEESKKLLAAFRRYKEGQE